MHVRGLFFSRSFLTFVVAALRPWVCWRINHSKSVPNLPDHDRGMNNHLFGGLFLPRFDSNNLSGFQAAQFQMFNHLVFDSTTNFSWWFVCLGRRTTPLNFCRFGRINPQMKHPPKISPHNPPHPPYVVGRATRRPGETFKDAICTWRSHQTKNSKRSGKKIECSCVSR